MKSPSEAWEVYVGNQPPEVFMERAAGTPRTPKQAVDEYLGHARKVFSWEPTEKELEQVSDALVAYIESNAKLMEEPNA